MDLEIRLFATLKDRAGRDRIRIEVGEPATVQHLVDKVTVEYPDLGALVSTSLIAVNRAFASLQTPINPGDEVAIFPPVSGGEEFPHPTYFSITDSEIELVEIQKHLVGPDVGAVVTFTGYVRGRTVRDGLPPQTLFLEYEAYSAMAESKMAQMAWEIWDRWPTVKGIAIVQHIGRLDVGDITTLVACAAGHRDEGAFEAARYGIDRLKEIVPVWKKEVSADKSVWVEGHYRPTELDN